MKKNNFKKSAFVSIFAIFFSAIVVSILTALYVLIIKQIENMNLDASSFQSLYMADSAFECALYKEQTATGTKSVFFYTNYQQFGYCATPGDVVFTTPPANSTGRQDSVLNISFTTSTGDFCGVITTKKEQVNSQNSNTMFVRGQNRNCTDPTSKVIEREIDFYY